MLRGRNDRFFFQMQNIFIVPAMHHGCRAKPQLARIGTDQWYVSFLLIRYYGMSGQLPEMNPQSRNLILGNSCTI